jgi:hypothetical protein
VAATKLDGTARQIEAGLEKERKRVEAAEAEVRSP